ncbi:MAG: 50S ribosomal protein L11 methyltransferase [Hyphomicrobiales bacterium]|nr:50S ribosomal protein L11 methyltransferase [Hyphomicrobiales bacterium]
MSQVKFSFIASEPVARQAYATLETAFEDDAYPLGLTEMGETADLHEVSLYADSDDASVAERVRALLDGVIGPGGIRREILPEIDWVAHSLEGLKPVRAARFFVHGRHDRGGRRPHDLAIEIEAGQAFGTGHHGTTAGCLQMIAAVAEREKPKNALDLGTGSAVLAIGLAKLAHIPVLATDIDPVAVQVAEENVRLNGMRSLVETRTATGFQHPVFAEEGPFDLIVANILARPLMRLAPDMARHLAPGGSLILSGILDRQRRAVLAAYSNQRFRHISTLHREGWTTLHLKHR